MWNLEGSFKVVQLGKGLLLFEFHSPKEAERVLSIGKRIFKGKYLHLERWSHDIGCTKNSEQIDKAWVRDVGLPVHLWSIELLKRIGESCGGFIAVDETTRFMTKLSWARMLVKVDDRVFPNSIEVVEGTKSFDIQLWWEIPTCIRQIKKLRFAEKGGNFEQRVERDVVLKVEESESNDGRQGLQGVQELEGNVPIKAMRMKKGMFQ